VRDFPPSVARRRPPFLFSLRSFWLLSRFFLFLFVFNYFYFCFRSLSSSSGTGQRAAAPPPMEDIIVVHQGDGDDNMCKKAFP